MGEGYEVDFLGVGAVCVRYGAPGHYRAMVYDCATREAGEAVVEHVRLQYGTRRLDYLVGSNPDLGRAAGLEVILENLEVGQFWMHRPWEYGDEMFLHLTAPRPPGDVAGEHLRSTLAAMFDLHELAATRGVRVLEPFKGAQIGAFHVMSPDLDWYVHSLLPDFGKAAAIPPVPAAAAASSESWGKETLREDVATSAQNESSVVLVGEIGDRKLLLTGDAGVRALTATADYAKSVGVSLPRSLDFVQVPHGGCRDNVSPSVLDRLIGQKCGGPSGERRKTAFALTGDGKGLPHETVVNAFLRRGWKVVGAGTESIRYGFGMPDPAPRPAGG